MMTGRSKRYTKRSGVLLNQGLWENFVDSDIEASDNDLDDDDSVQTCKKAIRIGSAVLSIEDEAFVESDSGDSEEEDFQGFSESDSSMNSNGSVAATGVKDTWIWTEKKDVKWSNGTIQKQSFHFKFDEVSCDDPADDCFSPLKYFMRYIPEALFDEMVQYTNTYAEQQATKKWYPTHKLEMKQFIGLQIMMGNLKLPRIEMYYAKELQCKMFVDTIPLYRFYLLRTNIHFVDVQTIPPNCTDKFVRVRPLMNSVRKRCLELPLEEYLSVDEQMIPMRGRVSKGVKQFVKNKPKIRWGIKNLVLCGKSGLAYDFICYQGATTEFDQEMLSKFGAGATMVLHLANRIDRSGHKLFFDNYFSTFPLFQILAQKQIYAAGTVRLDRFSKPPFSTDAEMKKKGRGCSEEVVSSDGTVSCVKWYDNKCVALASNYIGVGKPDTAHRYDKATQRKISIARPQIVGDYNTNMGGVDLMNQLISYYRISIRSRKWTLRMITHFIDFAIIQSWIEYKNDCSKSDMSPRQIMDLLAFRMQLSNQLVYFQTTSKRTARISLDELRAKNSRPDKSREYRTDINVRYDGYEHYPDFSKNRLRCKLETCNTKTQIICSKCNVHICLNNHNNCFRKYHQKN